MHLKIHLKLKINSDIPWCNFLRLGKGKQSMPQENDWIVQTISRSPSPGRMRQALPPSPSRQPAGRDAHNVWVLRR